MTVLASVRAVARSSIPRPPLKAPITITQPAMEKLHNLYQQRKLSINPPDSPVSPHSTAPQSVNDAKSHETSPHNTTTNAQKEFIKVAVRTKGCSGNAYTLDWVTLKDKFDEEVAINKNLSLLIDSKALFTLLGSQMDYVSEELTSGFVFKNPNVKETCGCGMSFIV